MTLTKVLMILMTLLTTLLITKSHLSPILQKVSVLGLSTMDSTSLL